MGEDGARDEDLLRARWHHMRLTDTIFKFFFFFFLSVIIRKKRYKLDVDFQPENRHLYITC